MSRDWDLLSVFIFPTVVFAAYLALLRTEQTISLRTTIAAVVWITLLHTTAWVGLNSSGSRAIERFQALHDARFWSRGALCNAYEELAIYYRNQQDFQRAQVLFEKFLSIDSTNGRVWVSFANLQKLRKDPEMEMRAWERAIQYGITREEALVELGKLYIWNEQLVAGRRLTEAALKLYPRSARLLNNMGVILAKEQQHCGEALPFFLEAIKSDSTAAEPYLNAGLCFEQAQDKTKMRYFLGKFLELAPDAPHAQQVRAALERQASPSRR
jgi:Tfp pilus assembly protein PilF